MSDNGAVMPQHPTPGSPHGPTMRPDVVVVGAGAAGGPLAARLSENPARSVLLLEAGPDCPSTDAFPPAVLRAADTSTSVPGQPYNWAFQANLTPELGASIARGKILGGSTALNGTYLMRGRRQDFDRWVELGNSAWSYEKVLPFYKKLERDLIFGDTAVHGGDGPVPVFRETVSLHPITRAFYDACTELGFPSEPDKNADGAPGYGPVPRNSLDGMRINTGIAYVNPARTRPNLQVCGSTYVRRVVFDGRRAVGVEVDRDGRQEIITAGEIVLSAGAIKSPHLLMLSGVGPRSELERHGISVVHDSPGVGKEFSDHPELWLSFKVRGYLRVAGRRDALQGALNFTSTVPQRGGGDLEILPILLPVGELKLASESAPSGALDVSMPDDLTFIVKVQQEDARGEISLQSRDPYVQPRIDYNYLSNELDLRRMREGVRTAVSILRSRAFAPHFDGLTDLATEVLADDGALNDWCHAHLASAIHMSGTCRMGPADDEMAVVDQFGVVNGVDGIRIADTSIFPVVPSRGPAGTAIMVGERIAHEIERAEARG
jgi:choline dehydrogenase